MLDFEAGLIKAFKHALPSANIQGCRFHLGQSWWKHIEQLGLAKTYKDASTRDGRWLRRCFSLKMLPADMVEAVFEHSVRLGRLDKAIPFVEYLRKYYILKDSAFPQPVGPDLPSKRQIMVLNHFIGILGTYLATCIQSLTFGNFSEQCAFTMN